MQETSLSLSQLLAQVGTLLKREFSTSTWIRAEILELNVNRSGHCYLELIEKDPDTETLLARTRATIWASRYRSLRAYFESSTGMPLKSGIKILCQVKLDFHSLYGFSINVSDIDPSYTLGDLARKKMEVIRRLKEEGVLDMNRELPFPRVPQRIAIISSETAAGYGDFIDSLHLNPQSFRFETELFQAAMQGDEAPGSIISALEKIYERAEDFHCLVLIRGGGSKADLECFNDYELAYHLSQFPIPVITGIGHDRDESVADLVAMHGLKTPTAVAEFLVERLLSFEFNLGALGDRLSMLVFSGVHKEQLYLENLEVRQGYLVKGIIRAQRDRNESMAATLGLLTRGWVLARQQDLDHMKAVLESKVHSYISQEKDRLKLCEVKAEGADPARILKQGYSVALHDGKILKEAGDLKPGDIVETRLHKGKAWSRVEKTENHE